MGQTTSLITFARFKKHFCNESCFPTCPERHSKLLEVSFIEGGAMFMSIGRKQLLSVGLFVALFAGINSKAQAAFGIIITDTILMPVGDPLTQYDFKLSLVAGNQLLQGDNITLLNVPNYLGPTSYVFVSGGIDYSQFFSIKTNQGAAPGLTSIELLFTANPGSLTNTSQTNNLSIGDLIVTTNVDYPPASNSSLFNPIAYTTQTHLFPLGILNQGAGFAPTPSIVPEPASLTMLAIGFGAIGLMIRDRKRFGCSV